MNSNQVSVYDTTLRDGTQAEGISFSVHDKIRIAEKLDAFGIRYIEGGWPGSNPKDIAFFAEAKKRSWKNALICAFGSSCRAHTKPEKDSQIALLLSAEPPVVTIVGKSWQLHAKSILGVSVEENRRMIRESVHYLKSQGRTVIFDAEHFFDGYKDDAEHALDTLRAAVEGGAEMVVLCDTNGGSMVNDVRGITTAVVQALKTPVGIHTHNDCELGVANALVAIQAGATQVQGTINGYGERTGNCNLISVIPLLHFKMKKTGVPATSLPKLKELSEFVDEIANMRHNPRQPWVGQTAFAHKGGMHVHAIDRVARSYEHIQPEAIGNSRRVLVSDMSGRTNILMKATELGFKLKPDMPEVKAITAHVKELEGQGYEYEAAEGSLALLIEKTLQPRKVPFNVETYHVSMRRDSKESVCEATVRVRVHNAVHHEVAEGDGPVNALDGALRAALAKSFPRLKHVSLTDYKVRILDSGSGTAAKTRVLIQSTDGKREWGTVGVDENIIEASLQALL